jgi:hypothetical protein
MKKLALIFSLTAALSQSCKDHDDDVEPVNEEELITTVQLQFIKWDEFSLPTGEPINFFWRDEDASGNPEIDPITLEAHANYTMKVWVFDESKDPVEDITEEITLESADHQFFFNVTGAEMTIEYNDSDGDGKPVGLENNVMVEHSSSGSLTVILRHQPDKSAAGVSDGLIQNAGGETDLETEFPITIIE